METWEAKAYIQDQAKVRNSTNIDIQLEIMRANGRDKGSNNKKCWKNIRNGKRV